MDTTNLEALKELQGDLARKYRKHGAKVEAIWRSMTPAQRSEAMKAGTPDGVVLKSSIDTSMGNVYKLIPEWNLKDIAAANSDKFLDMLKHRATQTLEEQYCSQPDGGNGDMQHIMLAMETQNLRHVDAFEDEWTLFVDNVGGQPYGHSLHINRGHEAEVMQGLRMVIERRLCIPRSMGELVLTRQLYLLQILTIMMDDVLEVGSEAGQAAAKKGSKETKKSLPEALAQLSMGVPRKKATQADLAAYAADQQSSYEDYLALLRTEPEVLAHAVNFVFFSRPELVADDKGRILPAHTDKYISAAVFDAVHDAVKNVATWTYLARLLRLLQPSLSKSERTLLLQEISNVLNLEFVRAQGLVRRHASTSVAPKWFVRRETTRARRVAVKGDPAKLATDDPQLHLVLQLCQAETNASKAAEHLAKLHDLHAAEPEEREDLGERALTAFYDLGVIVSITQSLTRIASVPTPSRKNRQAFIARMATTEEMVDRLRDLIDLRDFAVPIDNLLEPGEAAGALTYVDDFVENNTGTTMGAMYEAVVRDCTRQLEGVLTSSKDLETSSAAFNDFDSASSQQPGKFHPQEVRSKEKTRLAHSSSMLQTGEEAAPSAPEPEKPIFDLGNLKAETVKTFSTLFSRAENRGSVAWVASEAAMADLGFEIEPRYGSVYTFYPPPAMAEESKDPITFHRPHKSRIEGFLTLFYSRRLCRKYGWTIGTFEPAAIGA